MSKTLILLAFAMATVAEDVPKGSGTPLDIRVTLSGGSTTSAEGDGYYTAGFNSYFASQPFSGEDDDPEDPIRLSVAGYAPLTQGRAQFLMSLGLEWESTKDEYYSIDLGYSFFAARAGAGVRLHAGDICYFDLLGSIRVGAGTVYEGDVTTSSDLIQGDGDMTMFGAGLEASVIFPFEDKFLLGLQVRLDHNRTDEEVFFTGTTNGSYSGNTTYQTITAGLIFGIKLQ